MFLRHLFQSKKAIHPSSRGSFRVHFVHRHETLLNVRNTCHNIFKGHLKIHNYKDFGKGYL